ncbi:MAG: hypothetical protein AAB262_03960, partial [Elusimicrobiota bacterium]
MTVIRTFWVNVADRLPEPEGWNSTVYVPAPKLVQKAKPTQREFKLKGPPAMLSFDMIGPVASPARQNIFVTPVPESLCHTSIERL